jgi:hypothetical protein
MYQIIRWLPGHNIDDFYQEAAARGFVNNASQKAMIDCFKNEDDWRVWILYYASKPVGSVAAHTIDEGFRICARTCVLSDLLPLGSLRTRGQIANHQHVTAQYFMQACINWVDGRGDMYITSHPSEVGTQRLVHHVWGPTLERTGVLTRAFEKEYRGHVQTFWRLNTDVFMEQLEKSQWKWNQR